MAPLTTVVETVPFVDDVWIAIRWFEGFLSTRRVGITYTSASTVPFLDSIFKFRLVAAVSLGSKGGRNAVGIRSAGSIIHDPWILEFGCTMRMKLDGLMFGGAGGYRATAELSAYASWRWSSEYPGGGSYSK